MLKIKYFYRIILLKIRWFTDRIPEKQPHSITLKNKEIPVLDDYTKSPANSFWDVFPRCDLPSDQFTHINVSELNNLVNEVYPSLSSFHKELASHVIDNLLYGADTGVNGDKFPPSCQNNGEMPNEVALFFTDQLCSFVKNKFVSGPFDKPPWNDSRISMVFAIENSDKFRPILHLSKPKDLCYNDSIDFDKFRKVKMDTPRTVSHSVYKYGHQARLSKMDHKSAFKLMGVKPDLLKYQCFYWLGKYWVENRLIFGARTSVPLYDDIHLLFSACIRALSTSSDIKLHRVLDDLMVVAKDNHSGLHFVNMYKTWANKVNIELASEKDGKAFSDQEIGEMLGVTFSTATRSWSFSEKKVNKFLNCLGEVASSSRVNEKQLQRALGMINFVTQVFPPGKFYRAPLISDLKRAHLYGRINISTGSRLFLHWWMLVISDLKTGLPIYNLTKSPPAVAVVFVTDAAGASRTENPQSVDVGVGAVGYRIPGNTYLYVGQTVWPKSLVYSLLDDNGKEFGRKSTFLEAAGLLVPFCHRAKELSGQTVILENDNIGVVYAFQNGRSRSDDYASLMISTLHEVATRLRCAVYVQYRRRLSSSASIYADHLTRADFKGTKLVDSLTTVEMGWSPMLESWLTKPVIDWTLPPSLADDIIGKSH